jgi:hypothetical protein
MMQEEFPPLWQILLEKERREEEDHGNKEYSDPGFDGGWLVDHLRDNPPPAGSEHLTEKEKLCCSG